MSRVSTLSRASRGLGIAVSVFLGFFALDAFSTGKGVLASIPDFVVHLIPSLVLLLVVLLSRDRPWVGAIVFLGLAVGYAVRTWGRHPDWVVIVAGPLFAVGVLFVWSACLRGRTRSA